MSNLAILAAITLNTVSPPFVVPPMHSRTTGISLVPTYIAEMESTEGMFKTTPDPKERACLWAETGATFASVTLRVQYPREAAKFFNGATIMPPVELSRYRELETARSEFLVYVQKYCLGLDPKRYGALRLDILRNATKWLDEVQRTSLVRMEVTDALLRAGRCGPIPGSCSMSSMQPPVAQLVFRASILALGGAIALQGGSLALPFVWPTAKLAEAQ